MRASPPASGLTPVGEDIGRNGQRPRRSGLLAGWRRLPRLVRWGAAVVLLLLLVSQLVRLVGAPGGGPGAAQTPAVRARLVAHGVIAPVSQARVGTLTGGVLLGRSVGIGDRVEDHQELARVRGPADIEVLTAPFAGTVTGLLAHTGDTLTPGASVVMVADLTRLQVETRDVDEFLIAHVRPGQTIAMQIEALDRREVTGRVRAVALQPQTTPGGDQHYPVTIDLGGSQPDLRPGMSVRVNLSD